MRSFADDQLDVIVEPSATSNGVPLAIEIAAARARTMRPAEILAWLGEGVDVLARPRFRGDQRHRSLSGTIDWSYRLLDTDARSLFERLGVFPGPFTASLATAVAADIGLDATAADMALSSLVDSSLLVVESAGDTTRYRLLETVRAFVLSRLERNGAVDVAHDRFVDHVVTDVTAIMTVGATRWDNQGLGELLAIYDNIAAALRWCLAKDDGERGDCLLTAVLWGVIHQGHTDDIATLSDLAVRRWSDSDDPFAVDAAATAATARVPHRRCPRRSRPRRTCAPRRGRLDVRPVHPARVIGYVARRARRRWPGPGDAGGGSRSGSGERSPGDGDGGRGVSSADCSSTRTTRPSTRRSARSRRCGPRP